MPYWQGLQVMRLNSWCGQLHSKYGVKKQANVPFLQADCVRMLSLHR